MRASARIQSRGRFIAAPFRGGEVEGMQTFNEGPVSYDFSVDVAADGDMGG